MTGTYQTDRAFADNHEEQIANIILTAPGLAKLRTTITYDTDLDMSFATDLKIITDPDVGTFATRIRRHLDWKGWPLKYRDITIRTNRPTGTPTEIDKLWEPGGPRFYFYGWLNANEHFADWLITDLTKFTRQMAEQQGHKQGNYLSDETMFIAVPLNPIKHTFIDHQMTTSYGRAALL